MSFLHEGSLEESFSSKDQKQYHTCNSVLVKVCTYIKILREVGEHMNTPGSHPIVLHENLLTCSPNGFLTEVRKTIKGTKETRKINL